MIGYLILVHRYPQQFKRLFKAIYDPRNHYVIHVDKRAGKALDADIRAFVASYSHVEVLEAKPVQWGGYSMVDAELRGMERLLQMDGQWTHFINLSGQDFPLATQNQIMARLKAAPDQEFIRVLDQQAVRPDTMARVGQYVFETAKAIKRTRFSRRFLSGATPFIGTQWMVVSRQFCQFVCRDRAAARFKRFYRHTFIADEGFFQTVMMNSTAHGAVVNDDLRMIEWVPDGDIKLRPRTFVAQDAAMLIGSGNLFARKFDQTVDGDILDILERHLAGQDAANVDTPVVEIADVA
jgi:hypothetical protein